ncbi:MAG: heptaprenyl diphosphate synthase [Firmicutes bacterium HGW-Firmicutes-1]|jgi:heptaprenyl diphosphate synthase|nr:MAG: heptaprenyl diphosphate synthase [Firmicutes bacterium HGW-Firmicutes-1]
MPLYNKFQNISKTKKTVFIALLISMALVLSYFERFIPLLAYPGVKLGLANAITLTALYFLNFRETLTLVVIRIVMNALFVGNFISFWYSLSGGLLSFLVMFLCISLIGKHLSTVGISVAGAFAHNIGQLLVVAFITKSIGVALSFLPMLSISALFTGLTIGLTVKFLLPYIEKNAFRT